MPPLLQALTFWQEKNFGICEVEVWRAIHHFDFSATPEPVILKNSASVARVVSSLDGLRMETMDGVPVATGELRNFREKTMLEALIETSESERAREKSDG